MTEDARSASRILEQRQALREQHVVNDGRQLLGGLATCLRRQSLEEAGDAALRLLSGFLGASASGLFRFQAGRLTAVATLGATMPPGTRLPVRGLLQGLLQPSARPLLLTEVSQPWLQRDGHAGYEYFLPLVAREQVTGLLVLAGPPSAPVLSGSDQDWLDVLAPFLAAAWQEQASGRAGRLPERWRKELEQLTPREREVMSLLPRGCSNQRIAEQLGIKEGTVKTHIEHILAKLRLEDRAHAAARAVELRLGDTGS